MKLKESLLVFIVVGITAVLAVFSYWNLEGTLFHKPVDHKDITLQTTKLIYHQGEMVQAYVSFCSHSKVSPIIQWSLIDTYLRTYPKHEVVDPTHDCVNDLVVDVEQISETLPSDTYYFSGTSTYQLNPLKNVVILLHTNKFKVE